MGNVLITPYVGKGSLTFTKGKDDFLNLSDVDDVRLGIEQTPDENGYRGLLKISSVH